MGIFRRILDKLRKRTYDPLDIVEEFWEADFGKPKKRRFTGEKGESYRGFFEEGKLNLELRKKSLFAWIEDPLYRYRDLVIEGVIDFSLSKGHCSGGFLFRHTGADTYYYFLVSNTGYFRFDVVFNGNPIKLIGWTRITGDAADPCGIRIIANGTSFIFCINDETVAEIEDETIDAGGIAFAGQNYLEEDAVRLSLSELTVESRPYHVEAQYVRWRNIYPIAPEQRIAFGESLFNLGHYNPAVIQFKKAAKYRKLDTASLILFGESLLRLDLFDQVIDAADLILRSDPENIEGIILKADALYSLHRLIEGRAFIRESVEKVGGRPLLWNILGNTEYALGNIESAAEAYDEAARLDPDTAIFFINAGRSYYRAGDKVSALERYTKAARLFFRQEAVEDLISVLADIENIDPECPTAKELRGKLLFQDGEFEKAEELFRTLIENDTEDASIYYLEGLLRLREDDRTGARFYFRKAVELEDDYYLYWFKLAETEYALGRSPEEPLERALACESDDPWVYNFAGLLKMEAGELEEALEFFTKARGLDGGEADIYLNLSEALYSAGRAGEAVHLLEGFPGESGKVWNQLGNIRSRRGDFAAAAEAYEHCLAEDPDNTDYIGNAASVYIELEEYSRAEELLRRGLEIEPGGRQYNLMGTVAMKLGEYSRAEKAYEAGLALEPENRGIRGNLVDLLCTLGNFTKARKILEADEGFRETPKGAGLEKKISEGLEVRYVCSSCGREWIAPKNVEEQGVLRLRGELPDESPAGECPGCGALYCVACAKDHLDEGRFTCKHCGTHLKLLDERIKYLVSRYI